MEANRKRVQVHRVENITNEGSAWGKLLTTTFKTPQHLYFTTDEEIKEGDQMLTHEGIETAGYDGYSFDNGDEFCLKIIATTDPKLTKKKCTNCSGKGHIDRDGFRYCHCKTGEVYNIAQPSQDFIKAYCEQGDIDEVDVEYECPQCMEYGFINSCKRNCNQKFLQLKVDPIHNTITTHRIVEKMYSREELENLMMQSYIYGQSDKTDSFHKRESTIEKLIKEKLKQ